MATRFHWIIPQRLAGMELPGSVDPAIDDLMFLRKQGIDVVVSLTEAAPVFETHLKRRFEWLHFPIDDFGAPALEPTIQLVRDMDERLEAGRRLLVHCWAGIGRTGTILAAYMIYKYREPASGLIPWLRGIDRGYVQSAVQEEFLAAFSRAVLVLPAPRPPSNW